LLLPVDMREWLPEDDLVFIVLDAVAALDLGGFRRRYRADGHGRAAFDPEMMVALPLYRYCRGERSSRVIEKRCVRDVGYRVIAGELHPDHAPSPGSGRGTRRRWAGVIGGQRAPRGARAAGAGRRDGSARGL
jgi:transposase